MTSSAPPDIFGYLDYRDYVRDWFRAKKRANPRFSHRMFVRMAGMKSPSSVLQIIENRRNLAAASTKGMILAMQLNREQGRYFELLVAFDQAKAPEEKADAYTAIASTRRYRDAYQIEGESYRCLSYWYYPAIHELAQLPGFRAEPAWIAKRLRPMVSEAQARTALLELQSLGLLCMDAKGVLRPADGSLVTRQQVKGLAAHNYHRAMSELAGQSASRFRKEERHLLGLTVSIPRENVGELKAELDRFQRRLLELCDGAQADPDRVYQINLQLFPLSTPTQED